jgi:hypothetical protein
MASLTAAERRRRNMETQRLLSNQFSRWVVENPEASDRFPSSGHLVFQLDLPPGCPRAMMEQAEAFNQWAMTLARHQQRPGTEMVVVRCTPRPLIAATPDDLEEVLDTSPCDQFAEVLA